MIVADEFGSDTHKGKLFLVPNQRTMKEYSGVELNIGRF